MNEVAVEGRRALERLFVRMNRSTSRRPTKANWPTTGGRRPVSISGADAGHLAANLEVQLDSVERTRRTDHRTERLLDASVS